MSDSEYRNAANSDLLLPEHCTVKYKTFPGWNTSISKCRSFGELPAQAQAYIIQIQELVGVPGEICVIASLVCSNPLFIPVPLQ